MRLKGHLQTFPAKIICVLIEFETFFHNLFECSSLAAAQKPLSACPASQRKTLTASPNENHTAYHSTCIPLSPSTASHLFSLISFISQVIKSGKQCKTNSWWAQGLALKLACVSSSLDWCNQCRYSTVQNAFLKNKCYSDYSIQHSGSWSNIAYCNAVRNVQLYSFCTKLFFKLSKKS